MADPSSKVNNYIPSLNGLRAISVTMVILYHFNYHYLDNAVTVPWSFFFNGDLGVNVFFVISGYLITTLLNREIALTKRVSLKGFYIRRTLRIFPAYYFILFVYLVLQLCNVIHISNLSWVTSVTYTKYLYKPDWVTKHFWSLSVEEHFYLVWPLVFQQLPRFKKHFLLFVVIIVPVFRIINIYYNRDWMDGTSIFQRVDAIIYGCILALYYGPIKAYVNRLLSINKAFIFLPFIILFVLYLTQNQAYLMRYYNLLITAVGTTYGSIANLAIVAIIVISLEYKNVWYKFLNLPFVNFIGKLSYSLYLWQQIFLYPALKVVSIFPFNVAGIIVMALSSYYFIEKPFLKIKHKHKTA